MNRAFLFFVKLLNFLPVWFLFKPKVYYEDGAVKKLPRPAILMSNHTAFLDFILYLLLFFGRSVRFWMSEALFDKGGLFRRLLYALGGIKVERDLYELGFAEESCKTLSLGGVIGVFPQGRLPVDGKWFPFKPGIAIVALKTGAPIIPVYTDGNYGLTKRAHVMIGAPVYLRDYSTKEEPEKEELERLTKLLEQKTVALREELKRRMEQKK